MEYQLTTDKRHEAHYPDTPEFRMTGELVADWLVDFPQFRSQALQPRPHKVSLARVARTWMPWTWDLHSAVTFSRLQPNSQTTSRL